MHLFSMSRRGVAAKELERQLDVTYKTAWRMAHEIRTWMAEVNGDNTLDGDVITKVVPNVRKKTLQPIIQRSFASYRRDMKRAPA
ncbi:MAG: hypothetical protein OXN26_16845, partial [Gammaproteobacteria bacterium]|nr:hypothetical protein [Gammaproteobacteria bacterium]